jgi:hypothetical protein
MAYVFDLYSFDAEVRSGSVLTIDAFLGFQNINHQHSISPTRIIKQQTFDAPSW